MRLILDTHILLALLLALLKERLFVVAPSVARTLGERDIDACASVASLWEIAIKTRLGKLDPGMSLDLLPQSLETMGIGMLPDHGIPRAGAHRAASADAGSVRSPAVGAMRP